MSSRSSVKAGKLYSNVGRDLVDTFEQNGQILAEVSESQLPDVLQSMPAAKRADFVKQKSSERKAIQKQIAELSRKQIEDVENERKKWATSDDDTLGDAIQSAVTRQLRKSGFDFDR